MWSCETKRPGAASLREATTKPSLTYLGAPGGQAELGEHPHLSAMETGLVKETLVRLGEGYLGLGDPGLGWSPGVVSASMPH